MSCSSKLKLLQNYHHPHRRITASE